jgi:hypothetical protein
MSIGLIIWCWILIAPVVGIAMLSGLGGDHSAMGDGRRY